MTESSAGPHEETVVLTAETIAELLHQMAQEVIVENPDIEDVVLLGVLSRGRPLADRLAGLIEAMTQTRPPVGSLATTLYRDDLRSGRGSVKYQKGETHFEFSIDDRTVLLVDDVIAAGRTARAALDELMDYGRPRRIQLACLVDRGGRELPIQPDYLGWSLNADPADHVRVRLEETDGQEAVLLERIPQAPDAGDAGQEQAEES